MWCAVEGKRGAGSAGLVDGGRRRRGSTSYRGGLAAEDSVARHYAGRGGRIEARRWRRAEGEIDLVVRMAEALVFVEVKSGRQAEYGIAERQWRRLEAAALRYTVETETGDMCLRFDAALVGPDGAVSIVENARVF